jgi:hypothetical protein
MTVTLAIRKRWIWRVVFDLAFGEGSVRPRCALAEMIASTGEKADPNRKTNVPPFQGGT